MVASTASHRFAPSLSLRSGNGRIVSGAEAVQVGPDGVVNVSSPGVGLNCVYLYQVGGSTNGASSDACKAILVALLSAKATERPVQRAFNDSLSCGTRRSWTYLAGWYSGPSC
jgi:hypothetical protein